MSQHISIPSFTNLIAEPDASELAVTEAVNGIDPPAPPNFAPPTRCTLR
ncbi:MAG TPA: hypothetical protein VHX65_13150 [Pirellulales bacterium]|jgi:hypothetical protein|nr:hypothetical protein [Pirellulales bacterium]